MRRSAWRLLEKVKGFDTMDELTLKRFPVLGAYELALKCSHVFNLLDARGAISVTERVGVMARIRTLVVGVAKAYAAQGEALELLGAGSSKGTTGTVAAEAGVR